MFAPTHIAATSPTVNDDYNDGFRAGVYWWDITLSKWFFLVDHTVANAVWTDITGSSLGGWTVWKPTLGFTGNTPTGVTEVPRYIKLGNLVYFTLQVSGTTSAIMGNLTDFQSSLPDVYAVQNSSLVPITCFVDVAGVQSKAYIAEINSNVDPAFLTHTTWVNINAFAAFSLYYAGFYETE